MPRKANTRPIVVNVSDVENEDVSTVANELGFMYVSDFAKTAMLEYAKAHGIELEFDTVRKPLRARERVS